MTATAKREEQRSLPWLQLCVYDSRRGKAEGDEADKILAYYPPDVSTNEQASTVGLAQAVSAFAAIFSQDLPCEALHTERSLWVAHEPEPAIWMLLVAQRAWLGSSVREAALRQRLTRLHALCTLLHGPLQGLLDAASALDFISRCLIRFIADADPSGQSVRAVLGGLVAHWGERLSNARSAEHAALHAPLGPQDGVPLLPLPRPLFTSLQALMARLLIAQIGSAVPVQGALLLQEHWCLASTLSRADTFALHQLAASALLPAVQSATQPSLNKRLTSTLGWGSAEKGPRTLADRRAWRLLPSSFLVPAPSGGGKPGDAESAPELAQDGGERCGLLGLRSGQALLILLLSERRAASRELLDGLAAVAGPALPGIAQAAAAELTATGQWHLPGFRYVYADEMLLAVRASPAPKQATLSRESQALVQAVRADLDARSTQGDTEVVVRGAHDCWVVAKRAAARTIVVVLEGRGEDDVLGAAASADRFIEKHFEGLLQ